MKERVFEKEIIWEGDLSDDCLSRWSGLMLRAELMTEESWWWCVYDYLDDRKQIDSSNEYFETIKTGIEARKKAEKIARNYLLEELITDVKSGARAIDEDEFIKILKSTGLHAGSAIVGLTKAFDHDYVTSKNLVFDSVHWKGLREHSQSMTQIFFKTAAEMADEVEKEDGNIVSVKFDLAKNTSLDLDSEEE